nr:MAG TPA: hypothetical protein [Caudoviricetes sp.]
MNSKCQDCYLYILCFHLHKHQINGRLRLRSSQRPISPIQKRVCGVCRTL